MLNKRLLVAIVLGPLFIFLIHLGGWPYNLVLTAAFMVAAWEYGRIFRRGGFSPSLPVLLGGVLLLMTTRALNGLELCSLALCAVILAATAAHVLAYERGVESAGVDLAITLAGVLYIGWLGGYFISLRSLADGEWWLLLVLPTLWFVDTGAYLVGSRLGRHPFAPRTSPRKTWEGYFGGILLGTLAGTFLAWLWHFKVPAINPLDGLLLGIILGLITPLADLGESVIKRQFKLKDSSNFFPGHGGMFDRIDTWLWAVPIGYYLIHWLG